MYGCIWFLLGLFIFSVFNPGIYRETLGLDTTDRSCYGTSGDGSRWYDPSAVPNQDELLENHGVNSDKRHNWYSNTKVDRMEYQNSGKLLSYLIVEYPSTCTNENSPYYGQWPKSLRNQLKRLKMSEYEWEQTIGYR